MHQNFIKRHVECSAVIPSFQKSDIINPFILHVFSLLAGPQIYFFLLATNRQGLRRKYTIPSELCVYFWVTPAQNCLTHKSIASVKDLASNPKGCEPFRD